MRCLPRALVRGCGRGRVLVTINYLGVDKTAAATRLLLTLVLGRAESVFCSRCSPASAAPRLRWRRAAPATSAGGGPSALQGSASCRACDRRRRSRARRHPRRDRFAVAPLHAIANASALTLSAAERRWPRWISGIGLLGCVTLAFALPLATVLIGTAVVATGGAGYAVVHRHRCATRAEPARVVGSTARAIVSAGLFTSGGEL